ncbi:Uncharacterised protein [Mycolicibacterium vanbaalenii]|uniref:DUF4185 domain-containing protein n=1 Tax=Mycolicibacterium vanbaalenii TaxID=110539 RepID=A0A5S9MUG1_MYCVN|nr:DUF4185 domain-containing protein [Mycolicibacterium vanbaalenii]CAA0079758.1 Uncharacterised protein [Mycolicibacterium vanbaalenii]
MGAAAYVGRVGGLAVALGVGSAVFAGQGVAWADETDSSPSTSASSATSDRDSGSDAPSKRDATRDDDAAKDDAAADPDDDDPEPEVDDEIEDDAPDDDEDAEPEDDAPDEVEDIEEDLDDDVEDDDAEDAEPEPEPDTSSAPPTTKRSQSAPAEPSASEETSAAEKASVSEKSKTDTTKVPTDPAVAPQEPEKVAVFASASSLAAASPTTVSPRVAALLSSPTATAQEPKPSLVTAVVNVVNSMLDWARQKADATPDSPAQPPFLWALMSFARRELENLFVSRSTVSAARSTIVAPTSLALTADEITTAAAFVPYSPWLNPQVSPSTNFVSWVTGKNVYSDKTLANTLARYQVYGTDVGVMWDNGIPDDPSTPDINENQVLIAVGDTFGSANMSGRWIYNTLFRSSDDDLSDGMTIPDGEWFNGNMFGGAPLSGPTQARPIINRPSWAPNSVTLIPTAGISLPTPDTEFGATQYVSFMSVSNWGSSGRWTTNYSAIAYSTDNGENFTVARESVRYNSIFSGNRNFQQSAFVKGDDGHVYMYGTPNGRQGAAHLARVAEKDILNVSKYEYYKKASSGWFGGSPARWVQGNPSSASPIIGKTGGACGSTKPGNTVSEMSVQYNDYLEKYIVLYGDQSNNIVMRTSDTPEGEWSEATVLMGQQNGGIYAPMLHPWSPSTVGTGSDLYWNLSLWSEYNIMLMRTDLTKL